MTLGIRRRLLLVVIGAPVAVVVGVLLALGSIFSHESRAAESRAAHVLAGRRELTILYGGSVNPGNARDLLGDGGIDGFLVGGASLQAATFAALAQAAALPALLHCTASSLSVGDRSWAASCFSATARRTSVDMKKDGMKDDSMNDDSTTTDSTPTPPTPSR